MILRVCSAVYGSLISAGYDEKIRDVLEVIGIDHFIALGKELRMKLAGLLLLPAGWAIVISAVLLFPQLSLRWIFVLAGLCIEPEGWRWLSLVRPSRRRRLE